MIMSYHNKFSRTETNYFNLLQYIHCKPRTNYVFNQPNQCVSQRQNYQQKVVRLRRNRPELDPQLPQPQLIQTEIYQPSLTVLKMLAKWKFNSNKGLGKRLNGILEPIPIKKYTFTRQRRDGLIHFQPASFDDILTLESPQPQITSVCCHASTPEIVKPVVDAISIPTVNQIHVPLHFHGIVPIVHDSDAILVPQTHSLSVTIQSNCVPAIPSSAKLPACKKSPEAKKRRKIQRRLRETADQKLRRNAKKRDYTKKRQKNRNWV